MRSFKAITLQDKSELTPYLSLYPHNEGSECRFSNLFIWGDTETITWQIEKDALLLHLKGRHKEPCMLMAFAEADRLGEALEAAIIAMNTRGEPFKMSGLPVWYCDLMRARFPGRFHFEHEPHLDDYIYNLSDLISLRGKKFHGKRNHLNKFLSIYRERYIYEPFTPALREDCLRTYGQWFAGQHASLDLWEERRSVQLALENAEALGLVGGVVKVDDDVKAFSLGERITPDMALIHIEKASPEIPELFTIINHDFAAHAFSDLLWVNREEDMGDPGLHRAKKSYHPARMIEKYSATLAGAAFTQPLPEGCGK